jgi:hypothetical protein
MQVQAVGSSSMHARTCGMRMHAAAASRYLHGCYSFIHSQHRLAGSKSAGMLMRCKHADSAAARRAHPRAREQEHSSKQAHGICYQLTLTVTC